MPEVEQKQKSAVWLKQVFSILKMEIDDYEPDEVDVTEFLKHYMAGKKPVEAVVAELGLSVH